MKPSLRLPVSTALALALALPLVLRAENPEAPASTETPAAPTPARAGNTGADPGSLLWDDFVKKYEEISYAPMPPEDLDLAARKALLSGLGARYRSWKPDRAASFPELVAAVCQADPAQKPQDLVEKALAALLPGIDRFARYTSGDEIARLQEAARQSAGRIGMNIERESSGRLLCFPEPESPAWEAGVNYGAELLTVDGNPMEKKPLAAAKLAFVGPAPAVTVRIRQPQGKEETLSIPRSKEVVPVVSAKKIPGGLSVRIRSFDPGSASALRDILQQNQPVNRLTLDLRGNPGGVLKEAQLACSLFLPQGAVIGRQKNRAGEEPMTDGNGVTVEPASIQILMDRRSASSAEFLAASLRENLPEKVKLYGETSYGKNYSTYNPQLYGGGEMTVSEFILMTPSGKTWEKGLTPDVVQHSGGKAK